MGKEGRNQSPNGCFKGRGHTDRGKGLGNGRIEGVGMGRYNNPEVLYGDVVYKLDRG